MEVITKLKNATKFCKPFSGSKIKKIKLNIKNQYKAKYKHKNKQHLSLVYYMMLIKTKT